MGKFIQKYIVKVAERCHQEMALLSQDEDGLVAISENETAQHILNSDFDPWQLTIREIWQFSKTLRLTYEAAARLGIEREDKTLDYFCQLYHDIWQHYKDIPQLRYNWNAHTDKAEFSISGTELIFDCEEQSALQCIRILEDLARANEMFKKEVELRSKFGVMAPSTQACTAVEQVNNTNKKWLYSKINYDANGQPLPK